MLIGDPGPKEFIPETTGLKVVSDLLPDGNSVILLPCLYSGTYKVLFPPIVRQRAGCEFRCSRHVLQCAPALPISCVSCAATCSHVQPRDCLPHVTDCHMAHGAWCSECRDRERCSECKAVWQGRNNCRLARTTYSLYLNPLALGYLAT